MKERKQIFLSHTWEEDDLGRNTHHRAREVVNNLCSMGWTVLYGSMRRTWDHAWDGTTLTQKWYVGDRRLLNRSFAHHTSLRSESKSVRAKAIYQQRQLSQRVQLYHVSGEKKVTARCGGV